MSPFGWKISYSNGQSGGNFFDVDNIQKRRMRNAVIPTLASMFGVGVHVLKIANGIPIMMTSLLIFVIDTGQNL